MHKPSKENDQLAHVQSLQIAGKLHNTWAGVTAVTVCAVHKQGLFPYPRRWFEVPALSTDCLQPRLISKVLPEKNNPCRNSCVYQKKKMLSTPDTRALEVPSKSRLTVVQWCTPQ